MVVAQAPRETYNSQRFKFSYSRAASIQHPNLPLPPTQATCSNQVKEIETLNHPKFFTLVLGFQFWFNGLSSCSLRRLEAGSFLIMDSSFSGKFMDNTILSTPKPLVSSTVKKTKPELDMASTRLSGCVPSCRGSCSKSPENRPNVDLEEARATTMKIIRESYAQQREIANDCLKKAAELRNHATLPSRFLRPSEISNCSSVFNETSSTINESDLVPHAISTPRISSDTLDSIPRRCESGLGQSMARLSCSIKNPNMNFDQILKEFQKTMNVEYESFRPAEELESQLAADEASWRRQNELPVSRTDISLGPDCSLPKESVGEFFRARSSNVSDLLDKSPEKKQKPVPLIETSINDSNVEESLSISAIARALATSENSPTRLIDKFLTKKSDKENICNDTRSSVDTKKSLASMRSASSLSSLPEGKLPIETTKTELVWGCVKKGKTLSQDFVIRNRSSNRLRIQCSLTSPAFKIMKDSESLTTIKLILQPYEVRTITVAFVPVAVGAAVDQIKFTSLDPYHEQNKKQMVRLFGYGGSSTVSVNDIYKDTTGKFLLSLGYLDKSHNLERSFKVRNIGTLPSFTHIIITKREINCCVELLVSPKRFVLLPNEEKEIKFTSTRSKDSLKGFHNAVMELGTVKLVSGPEVIRGRLRRLCRKASSMGEHVDDFIAQLVEKIPGEVMPDDLQHLKESAQAMPELLKCLTQKDVTVVLEQDADATLVPPLCDETLMFQSLCESNLTIINNTVRVGLSKVEPSSLILISPTKMEDLIFLTSSGNKNYEINCSPEGLDVRPNRGVIAADETVIVRVRSGSNVRNGSKFNLTINLDNEAFHVDVKVIVVNVS